MAWLPHKRLWKRLSKPGLPEALGIALVAIAVVPATLWWRDANQPDWRETVGHVVTCRIQPTHYNAEDTPNKVVMTYRYSVGPAVFTATWQGYWPHVRSPNAVPKDRLTALLQKDYPLVVLYDPADPSRSRLHYPGSDNQVLYAGLFVIAFLIAGAYFVLVYPKWRTP